MPFKKKTKKSSKKIPFTKISTSISDQCRLLIQRGLVCSDTAEVEKYLGAIGYYRFSGYWLPFEEPPVAGTTRSKRFKAGTTFEELVALYVFDRRLRLLVMEAIERIEINIRSRWVNAFSLAHTPHAYLDPRLSTDPWRHTSMVNTLAARVQQSSEPFIEHYTGKYLPPHMPPLWAVAETMTLGELSMWFPLTNDYRVQDAVAKDVGLPSREVLSSILQVFALVRNICAHHGRLWNRHLVKRIPLFKALRNQLVMEPPKKGAKGGPQSRNEIYNVLIAILHMLSAQQADTSFPRRLKTELLKATEDQRAAMGFPSDWMTRPAWIDAPESGTFQGSVEMAVNGLADAIRHLQRAGALATDGAEREAVTARIASLDLARQHVIALRPPGDPPG